MADQRSLEMLTFIFACKTFAYPRLAQDLSRAFPDFSSLIREYLYMVINADQCAQYVDDIGIAANDAEQLQQPSGHLPVYPESWREGNDA